MSCSVSFLVSLPCSAPLCVCLCVSAHVCLYPICHDLAPPGRKLTFVYLANDVLQNSKKKGSEYSKEFSEVLEEVFQDLYQ